MRWLAKLLTERDNATPDLKRVLWAVCVIVGLGLDIFVIVHRGDKFSLPDFSLGVTGLLASGGGVLALNRKNENGSPE